MIDELIGRYPALAECAAQIEEAVAAVVACARAGGKILLCGNGGSAADCEHIAGELMKSFMLPRAISPEETAAYRAHADLPFEKLQRGIPAISLCSQSGIFTAWCNDADADLIYAQLAQVYARENDMMIALSTSGNSQNVVAAAAVMRAKGLPVVALTGARPCKLDALATVIIHAPETETYRVQEYHLPIYHYICAEAERILFS